MAKDDRPATAARSDADWFVLDEAVEGTYWRDVDAEVIRSTIDVISRAGANVKFYRTQEGSLGLEVFFMGTPKRWHPESAGSAVGRLEQVFFDSVVYT
jgi:hypothetical protein